MDAWARRLESEWTCAQFASSLQANPQLALDVYRNKGEVRSHDARARRISMRTPII